MNAKFYRLQVCVLFITYAITGMETEKKTSLPTLDQVISKKDTEAILKLGTTAAGSVIGFRKDGVIEKITSESDDEKLETIAPVTSELKNGVKYSIDKNTSKIVVATKHGNRIAGLMRSVGLYIRDIDKDQSYFLTVDLVNNFAISADGLQVATALQRKNQHHLMHYHVPQFNENLENEINEHRLTDANNSENISGFTEVLKFDETGQQFAESTGSSILIWDTKNLERKPKVLSLTQQKVKAMDFGGSKNEYLIAGMQDGSIVVIDIKTELKYFKFSDHKLPIAALEYSKDKNRIISLAKQPSDKSEQSEIGNFKNPIPSMELTKQFGGSMLNNDFIDVNFEYPD